MSSLDYTLVLNDTIDAIIDSREYTHHLEQLSTMINQGAVGRLSPVLDRFRPRARDTIPYMTHLEELLYFLLSEGISPDVSDIRLCCHRASTRLLEDLLKYYDGPRQIEFQSIPRNHPPMPYVLKSAEVLFGFGIQVVFQVSIHQKRYNLSLLEESFIFHALRPYSDAIPKKFIEQASAMCPPPDMQKVLSLATEININREKVQHAYEFYQGK